MDNKEKYKSIFIESLAIDLSKFNENIKYNEIPEWDSIGHMTLMSGLEEGFNIAIETDDIVDFSSFKKGLEILEKHKIEFK
jgi:acyl carrier protein